MVLLGCPTIVRGLMFCCCAFFLFTKHLISELAEWLLRNLCKMLGLELNWKKNSLRLWGIKKSTALTLIATFYSVTDQIRILSEAS